MNIVVLMIDTLRYDYLGANGNEWIETPNMDRLCRESWCFDHYYAASYPTVPHRTDVLTGEYGSPVHTWQPLGWDRVTFPRVLAHHGYATQIIHDTPHLVNGGHNFDWPFHFWTQVRGGEVDRPWIDKLPEQWPGNWKQDPMWDSDAPRAPHWAGIPYTFANRKRRDHDDWNCAKLFNTASRWLHDNAKRENFFLWIDCFDPHEPWDAPEQFMLKYDRRDGYDGSIDPRSFACRNDPGIPEEAKQHVAAQYAAKTTWMDHNLGRFLDAMDELKMWDNTAVVLLSDHGTNVGERGKFGKGFPVREQEGHIVMAIRTPRGDAGRSDMIVQPQDLWATVCGLAGVPTRPGIDSHDVLSLARAGDRSPRRIALSGNSAEGWGDERRPCIITCFDGEWGMEVGLKPEDSSLVRMGSLENVAGDHADVVRRLHAETLDEIERRGAHPDLMAWLRSGGETPFPVACPKHAAWPKPAGYESYFNRCYRGE